MKKLFMLIMAIMLIAPLVVTTATAQLPEENYNPYGLKWTANIEEDLWGYRVYVADTSNGQTKGEEYAVISIPKEYTAYAIPVSQPDGKAFWRVTALDLAKNESGFSIELETEFDHTAPITPIGCSVMQEPPTP